MRQKRNLDMAVELQYEEFRGVVSDEDGPRDSSKIERASHLSSRLAE
jgi:hypothetical protein